MREIEREKESGVRETERERHERDRERERESGVRETERERAA